MNARLNALNTHFVGVVGLSFGFLGGVVNFLNTNPQVSNAVLGVLPADDRGIIGGAISFGGLILAYLGRPKTIAPPDKVQVAEAEALGEPRPVTPAKP
jgi:hypothetical protein